MRSVWLSPGFPAAPAALLDSLGADFTLAAPSTTPPAGSIAVVTGFEGDLLSQLATRPADTSLVVVTPPDAPLAADVVSELRPDAIVAAASIAEVATALRRLPATAIPAAADMADTTQELPWWIRPSQDVPPTPASGGQPTHDTAVYATAPLPAFGQPVDPSGAPSTETLAMGSDEPPRRRFALTGRQARIASIAAVVIAMAATGVAVALPHHSSPTSNAAATSPLGGANNGGGNNTSPFGNSNGSSGSNGSNGQGGLGNGAAPQFGNQNPFSGQSGQGGTGTRRAEVQQFLACLKQNGVTITGNNFRSLDPSDPTLRTALEKCASLMPFGRLRDRFGGSSGGTGTGSGGTNGTGTTATNQNSSHST